MSVQRSRRHFATRLFTATAAAALGFGLLTACGDSSDAASGETRVFTADNGEVTIPVDPQRIVATGYAVPALVESDAPLVGISTWERGVAVMTPEDKAEYDELDKIAGESATETNYEAIANAKPDLIIIGVPKPVLPQLDLDRLASIAPVVALGPQHPSDWKDLTKRQLDAAGQSDFYNKAKQAYDEKAGELKEKYAGVFGDLTFGHLGAYGEVSSGEFLREFKDSWGTNIAQDIGANYTGEVKKKEGGSSDVSEYPSIEELPASFAGVDVITYTLQDDGTPNESVQYVLDSPLWQNLPQVKNGNAIGVRYTEAATYGSAMKTLDALDTAFTPLLEKAPAGS